MTHIERSAVDVGRARRQWEGYVAALGTAGWEIVEAPPADDCPDAVFVEDVLVVHEDLAIVTRPGAPERRPETTGVEDVVRGLGMRVEHVAGPATLDGGDVLRTGGVAYVGVGGRTDAAGVARLRELLEPYGVPVRGVPVTRALHLKSACTALPDGTVVGWGPVVDDPSVFARYEEVPEEGGAHVVVLDGDHLLMAASAPATADRFRDRGYRVTAVDISELERLEGCVTCLSVRVRR